MTLTSFVKQAFSTGAHADVTLEVGSGAELVSIHAHSFILRRSEYFQAALASEFKEALTKKFVIDDVKPRYFSWIVESLYTDDLPVPPELSVIEMLEIMGMCRRFEIPQAISLSLVPVIKSRIDLGKNVVGSLAKAYDLDLQDAADSILDAVTAEVIRFRAVKEEMSVASSSDIASEVSFVKARLSLCEKFTKLLGSLSFNPEINIQDELRGLHVAGRLFGRDVFAEDSVRRIISEAADDEKRIREDYEYFREMLCFVNKAQQELFAVSHQLLSSSKFASPLVTKVQEETPPKMEKTDNEEEAFWRRNTRPPAKRRRGA